MTYNEALAQIKADYDALVRRPRWPPYLGMGETMSGGVYLTEVENLYRLTMGIGEGYEPTADDMAAADWEAIDPRPLIEAEFHAKVADRIGEDLHAEIDRMRALPESQRAANAPAMMAAVERLLGLIIGDLVAEREYRDSHLDER
jgi:hypothetical protein